jgi:hypothetical protein
MKNWGTILCIALLATGCRKAFTPHAISSANNRYLVIEGIVNSGADSTLIKIGRTQRIDTIHTIQPEANAVVSVESDANGIYKLTEKVLGTYVAVALNLDPAHKYRLRIKTSSNKEYVSDFVAVKNAPPVDSVGFVARPSGVHIYVNSHDDKNATQYYRWEYSETWQFHAKYVSANVSNHIDSIRGRHANEKVHDCFGHDTSSNIIIASTTKLAKDIIYQAPVTTVSPTSEKIETKYSVLVKQYALTEDAYAFWQNLQNNTEKLGSIFDVLPTDNQTNFHCLTNPNELVVGYLSVGSPSSKRLFITVDQLLKSYSPAYPCVCVIDTLFFDPTGHHGNLPWSELLRANSFYTPLIYLYPVPDPLGGPYAITYSTVLCADCTVRGFKAPPPFWK